jgi:hypothetical protein
VRDVRRQAVRRHGAALALARQSALAGTDFLGPKFVFFGMSISLCNHRERKGWMRVADGTTEEIDMSAASSGEHFVPTGRPRRRYPNYGI